MTHDCEGDVFAGFRGEQSDRQFDQLPPKPQLRPQGQQK
ncbi:MAG: hypothetical protein QOH31_3885 [Verrucomicrobiota bacterium]|jgi:hypothetical protein